MGQKSLENGEQECTGDPRFLLVVIFACSSMTKTILHIANWRKNISGRDQKGWAPSPTVNAVTIQIVQALTGTRGKAAPIKATKQNDISSTLGIREGG
jgi:hypothetical protein